MRSYVGCTLADGCTLARTLASLHAGRCVWPLGVGLQRWPDDSQRWPLLAVFLAAGQTRQESVAQIDA